MYHFLAALHVLPSMSQTRLEKLYELFQGDLERAWYALSPKILGSIGYKSEQIGAAIARHETLDIQNVCGHLERTGISILMNGDRNFPESFRHVYPKPFFVYVQGNRELLQGSNIGIVGTRKITSYGKQVIDSFVPSLVRAGIPIVSGLAFGVDASVHRKVLEFRGKTVGVLGSGLDVPYPATNALLAREIIREEGLLLSEFPLGKSPEPFHFPLRNRFIAALSKALLVVEAGEKSGALITAELAIEQGREVFAVPGNIFSEYSKGTHRLLMRGEAHLAESPRQMLEVLGVEVSANRSNKPNLSTELEVFLEYFSFLPEEQEVLFARTGLPITVFQMQITLLELEGLIKKVEGTKWVRKVLSF